MSRTTEKPLYDLTICIYSQKSGYQINYPQISHQRTHTQNEDDSAYSLIKCQAKRQLRGNPMYPYVYLHAFISAVLAAKKTGTPFNVNELTFKDFLDVKDLGLDIIIAKMTNVKVIKVQKEYPTSPFIKTSYEDDFKKVEEKTAKFNSVEICNSLK